MNNMITQFTILLQLQVNTLMIDRQPPSHHMLLTSINKNAMTRMSLVVRQNQTPIMQKLTN